MKKELVIFDLDGTLLNTLDDLADAVNHVLREMGYGTHPTEAFKTFTGNGIDIMFERVLPEGEKTEDNIREMHRRFVPYYTEHSHDATRPYDGIPKLIKELRRRRIKRGVASNKFDAGAKNVIKTMFEEGDFNSVMGLREGHEPKPDADIVRAVMKECGVGSKEKVIYVGDTAVDMKTAENGRVESVGVTWGFRTEDELTKAGARHIIHHPDELLGLV